MPDSCVIPVDGKLGRAEENQQGRVAFSDRLRDVCADGETNPSHRTRASLSQARAAHVGQPPWTCSYCNSICRLNEDGRYLACSRCKLCLYCSADCQRQHWRTRHHLECHAPLCGADTTRIECCHCGSRCLPGRGGKFLACGSCKMAICSARCQVKGQAGQLLPLTPRRPSTPSNQLADCTSAQLLPLPPPVHPSILRLDTRSRPCFCAVCAREARKPRRGGRGNRARAITLRRSDLCLYKRRRKAILCALPHAPQSKPSRMTLECGRSGIQICCQQGRKSEHRARRGWRPGRWRPCSR